MGYQMQQEPDSQNQQWKNRLMSTPSMQALKAARRIAHFKACCAGIEHLPSAYSEGDIKRMAEIIDEESSHQELLNCLALLLKMHRDGDVTSDVLAECESAIASAEGKAKL